MLPGFKERLSEELKNALETPRYSALAALKDAIKFHDPPAKANYTAWLGGEGLMLILLMNCLLVPKKIRPHCKTYMENSPENFLT